MKSVLLTIVTYLCFFNSFAADLSWLEFTCEGISDDQENLYLGRYTGDRYIRVDYQFEVGEIFFFLEEKETSYDNGVKFSSGVVHGEHFTGGGSQSFSLELDYPQEIVTIKVTASSQNGNSTKSYVMTCLLSVDKD